MRCGERGFALMAALWFIVALSVFGAIGITAARSGTLAARNRVLLRRAEWAREGCAEILLARYAADPATRVLPVVDLGRGSWCRATAEDPDSKVDLNAATRETLAELVCAVGPAFCHDSSVSAMVSVRDRGPFRDLRHFAELAHLDTALLPLLDPVLTMRGTGAVNVAAAPASVLRTLPGLGEEAVSIALARARGGRPLQSLDELIAALSSRGRAAVLARYGDLARMTTFKAVRLVITVEGGVHGTPIVARGILTAVPSQKRLAILRREME